MAGPAMVGGGCVAVTLALLLLLSWTSIAPTEMALSYNFVFRTVSDQVMSTPGIHLIGPFTYLIRYPKTLRTLEFDESHRDLMDGRTFDGLPLVLGVTFQYRLLPEGLFGLYNEYENNPQDFEKIYRLVGVHVITEAATKFTAYQFFNEKQKIAEVMRKALDEYFVKYLYATVESLQLNEDELPSVFTETILTAATSKQNITRMERVRDAKVVEFQTAMLVAEAQANVTIQQAFGERNKILQNGKAETTIIEAYVQAESRAYRQFYTNLNFTGDNLLKYIWYDTLSGGSVAAATSGSGAQVERNMEVLFGANPAAYMSQNQAR